jgi:hypothetical protein
VSILFISLSAENFSGRFFYLTSCNYRHPIIMDKSSSMI